MSTVTKTGVLPKRNSRKESSKEAAGTIDGVAIVEEEIVEEVKETADPAPARALIALHVPAPEISAGDHPTESRELPLHPAAPEPPQAAPLSDLPVR